MRRRKKKASSPPKKARQEQAFHDGEAINSATLERVETEPTKENPPAHLDIERKTNGKKKKRIPDPARPQPRPSPNPFRKTPPYIFLVYGAAIRAGGSVLAKTGPRPGHASLSSRA